MDYYMVVRPIDRKPPESPPIGTRICADERPSPRTGLQLTGSGVVVSLETAMYKLVQTSRLYEQIVQQIEESIRKGALKAGDQLPAERELAEQFGVSRTAVREAVKALREKGLVEAYPGKGTFITSGSSNPMRQSIDR